MASVLLFSVFFLEIFTTLLTIQYHKCLFNMQNHIDKVGYVLFVEKVLRWNSTWMNIYKKAPNLVWAPCGRYQDIRLLLQNPKLLRNAMDFNSHNLSNKSQYGPFEFFSFVSTWVFEFCHNLDCWALSKFRYLSLVTIWKIYK